MKKTISIILLILLLSNIFIPTIIFAEKEKVIKQSIPDKYFDDCPIHGNIISAKLRSNSFENDILIWTPYNYSKYIKYDVILLLHGGGGTLHDLMDHIQLINGKYTSLSNIYDWIVYDNINIQPFIIVTINNRVNRKLVCDEIVEAFKYIAYNYNTYAKDTSDQSIIDARNHFMVGGLSNGSVTTYAFMGLKLEYAANYLCMSSYVDKAVNFNNTNYKMNYFIIGAGKKEPTHHDISVAAYKDLKKFSKYNNLYIYNSAHDWTTWSNCIYDTLLYMFNHKSDTCTYIINTLYYKLKEYNIG